MPQCLSPVPGPAVEAASCPGRGRLTTSGWLLVAVVLLSGVVGGIGRGLEDRPNWGSLKRESAGVWAHRASNPATAMFGYLPTATFAHYYLALAFPALAVNWRRLRAERQRLAGRWSAGTRLAAAAMVAWGLGVGKCVPAGVGQRKGGEIGISPQRETN